MKRNTTQRTAIKEIFRQHDRPLAVAEILGYGRERVSSLNQATVYRNLKILIDEGWLIQFTHPEMGTLYERNAKEHHHHFHCRMCNRTFDIPGCSLKENPILPRGFVLEDHQVFLSGVCPPCRETDAHDGAERRKLLTAPKKGLAIREGP